LPLHFHEAQVDQDPEVIRADRYYFRAPALYVVQRPAKANSVLKLKTGKACLWFRHFRFAFSPALPVGTGDFLASNPFSVKRK
jgi:hypothetical protein